MAGKLSADILKLETVKAYTDKAFAKLKDLLGIEEYAATAIFIDPKAKSSDDNDRKLDDFCGKI